jgi:hypothetical protein
MRQVREVVRLKHPCGQSGHRIASAVGISRCTVAEYLRRTAAVGIPWPVAPQLDDAALQRKLFTPPGFVATETARPQPDWSRLHAELRRPGVTLLPLWGRMPGGAAEGIWLQPFCGGPDYVAPAMQRAGFAGSGRNIILVGVATTNLSGRP